jgi:hypothetical protein
VRATVAMAVLLILGSSSSAALAEEAPKKAKLKIAVLDVKSSGTIDPKTFEGVSSLIATELSQKRPDVTVVGAAEIRAMIGFEKEKVLLGCSEGACLAEIGGALGVEYLLATEGLRLGGTWAITMSLIDVAKSKPVARSSQRTKTDDKLVDICLEAVREVARALPVAAAVGAKPAETKPAETKPDEAKPAEVVPAEAKPAAAVATKGAGGYATPGWALFGVGAGVAVAGASMLGYAWSVHGGYATGQVTRDEARTADLVSKVGVVGISVGAAALATGIILVALPSGADAPKVAISPIARGAYASVAFNLP